MDYRISQITREDIPDIHMLYRKIYADTPREIKGTRELEWLFKDPSGGTDLLGFIARTPQKKVAGVIGYSLNPYRFGTVELKGVIPMSWMIAPAYRGLLGIHLLKKVMIEGDFSFAIQGSDVAQHSYRAVRLKYVGAAHIYTKILRPLAYIRSGKEITLKAAVKSCYLLGPKKGFPGKSLLSLKADPGSEGLHHSPVKHLSMIPRANRNLWLKACPNVEMLSYTLYHQGEEKGPALCYISEMKGIRRGRIVHIPYMGDDTNNYRYAIALLEQELVGHGCCSINGLAMQSASRRAYIQQGYRTHQHARRSLYVSDPGNRLDGVDLKQWYLSFYESDKGYRGI